MRPNLIHRVLLKSGASQHSKLSDNPFSVNHTKGFVKATNRRPIQPHDPRCNSLSLIARLSNIPRTTKRSTIKDNKGIPKNPHLATNKSHHKQLIQSNGIGNEERPHRSSTEDCHSSKDETKLTFKALSLDAAARYIFDLLRPPFLVFFLLFFFCTVGLPAARRST